MGGRIWAKPRDSGGAEFGFSLPLWVEDQVEEASGVPASAWSPLESVEVRTQTA